MAWLQKIEYEAPVMFDFTRFYVDQVGGAFIPSTFHWLYHQPLQPHHTTNTARCVAHWDAKKRPFPLLFFNNFFSTISLVPRLKFSTPLVESGSFYLPFNQSNNRPLHSHHHHHHHCVLYYCPLRRKKTSVSISLIFNNFFPLISSSIETSIFDV